MEQEVKQPVKRARITRSKSKSRFAQGYYLPKHPEKYIGDVTKIRYMSSWELRTHQFFDNNPNILRWSSETIAIPYIKPTDGRTHKYFPDYYVEYKNQKGELVREILEVKPASQTRKARSNSKHKLYEDVTYAINMAKWDAAAQYCAKMGIKFRIITEKSIFK